MTTTFPQTIKCAICGASNEVFVLGSTNSFGSPDLDLRPPGMARNNLPIEIQTCSNCGFSAHDISDDFFEEIEDEQEKTSKSISLQSL